MKKRISISSIAVAAALVLSALAGCSSGGSPESAPAQSGSSAAVSGETASPSTPASASSSEGGAPLFADPVTLSMMIPSHASWPFQEDWYVLDLVKEYANVSFKITSVDTSGFNEKMNLTMASGELPDLIYPIGNATIQQYAPQGAFVNILDHLGEMPSFNAWFEGNKQYALNYMSGDGGLYQFPQQGVEETERRGWLYRADILEAQGLKAPTNRDEFYDVLVKLKAAYPDSYPLAFRSFAGTMAQMNMIAPPWGAHYLDLTDNRYFGYDYDAGEWVFGPTSPEFKEMLEFYNKLYREGLLLPNFLTIDTKGWQDVMANSDSFITIDYLSRIDFFNNAMRESNPDFNMSYLAPPAFSEEVGARFAYSAKVLLGFAVSSQTKQLDQALAYIDWMYSDEGKDLLSWGRPGDLYEEDAQGNRSWKNFTTAAEMKQTTGFETYGFYQLYNFDGELSTFSPECRAATEEARKYDLPQQPILSYNDAEQSIVNTVGTNVKTFVDEQISKFLIGERSFDEWDAYVAELEALGLGQLKEVHDSSYARVLAAQKG